MHSHAGLPGAQFEVAPEGTEAYMAPEQLAVWSPEMCLPQKGRKYTAQEVFAGDVWAGGITAFRLLLGRPYTLPTCSPACFYLEGDAQQMTRALQVSTASNHALHALLPCHNLLWTDLTYWSCQLHSMMVVQPGLECLQCSPGLTFHPQCC